jgi:hypothetical protein
MFIRNKIKAKLALYYHSSIEDERSEEWELNDMEDWFLLHLQDKASTNICKKNKNGNCLDTRGACIHNHRFGG